MLFLSSQRLMVIRDGAASIIMILCMSLRGSERLRCAQEEKVVTKKAFRKQNEHSQAGYAELRRAERSWAVLSGAGLS